MPTVRFTRNIQRHVACPTEEVGGATLAAALESYFATHGPAPLYLHADDMHWSPEGQDLAARVVAETVQATERPAR